MRSGERESERGSEIERMTVKRRNSTHSRIRFIFGHCFRNILHDIIE